MSLILLKEFIELNVNTDMMIKNVKLVELNKSIETMFLNTKMLTLFRMGGGGGLKGPIPAFHLYLLRTQDLGLKTLWLLVLTLLPHYCKISSLYLGPVPNYWTWTKTTPQKKLFFRSNPYKIEVMVTFLIEMPQLPNFGRMITSII